ncbi:hypothetical protein AB6A40_000863 [Gnathostoma spinigerum]|uniref:Uncharacterized protein n=1 Tax=Gnathostoma spinigerum TaxID=75299 RepID=A0ABD6E7K6_9BILA
MSSDGLVSLVSYVPIISQENSRFTVGIQPPVVDRIDVSAANHQGTIVSSCYNPPVCAKQLAAVDFQKLHRGFSPLDQVPPRIATKDRAGLEVISAANCPRRLFTSRDSAKSVQRQQTNIANRPLSSNATVINKARRKKTVAFGTTVNLSQTVEGSSHRQVKHSPTKMAARNDMKNAEEQPETVKIKFEEQTKKIEELCRSVEDLQQKDREKEQQLLELTEMVKKVLSSSSNDETHRDGKTPRSAPVWSKSSHMSKYRGKENIPPWEMGENRGDNLKDSFETHKERVCQKRIPCEDIRSSRKSDIDDRKWELIRRKVEENADFKNYINQGVMRFAGDHSLDVVVRENLENDVVIRRNQNASNEKEKDSSPASLRKTTKVTRKMTVEEEVEHCAKESPGRSAAFSYDSRKYLVRHGIIPGVTSDQDADYDLEARGNVAAVTHSLYRSGESCTYYPNDDHQRTSRSAFRPLNRSGLVQDRYEHYCCACRKKAHDDVIHQCQEREGPTGMYRYRVEHASSPNEDLLNEYVEFSDSSSDENGIAHQKHTNSTWNGATSRKQRQGRNHREVRLNKTTYQ